MEDKKTSFDSFNTFVFTGRILTNKVSVEKKKTAKSEMIKMKLSLKSGYNIHNLEKVFFKPLDESRDVFYFVDKEKEARKIAFSKRKEIEVDKLSHLHCKLSTRENEQRYVSEYDFMIDLYKAIQDGIITNNDIVKINGSIDYNNYVKDGIKKTYANYNFKKIEVLPMNEDGTPPRESSFASIKMYTEKDSFFKLDNVGILSGKALTKKREKDPNGQDLYEASDVSVEIELGDNPDRVFEILKDKYTPKTNNLGLVGLNVEVINGSPEVEFTEDMLSKQDRELIDIGFTTFDALKKEKGIGKGEFVKKYKFVSNIRGYSEGAKEMVFTLEDITGAKEVTLEEIKSDSSNLTELDDRDIFGEDTPF
ncbi:hypothetical protein [Peptostreptococcus faecalis]|uniref:hypothetical protein n=1 Tax=Peptostreptococcus faecalis TaxID=2045015 RepID=UPI000C7E29D1|nr:hypothetical protein [Peptostreptococcus faecalis]